MELRTGIVKALSAPLAAFSILLFGSGCGPTVKSSLAPGGTLPISVAVLPADYSVDIPRERVDYIRSSLIGELRNARFVVVDDRVLTSSCSSPSCPELSSLTKKYLIDGVVTLKLDSVSRNNFIAGYYNQVSGDLSFSDKVGKELVKVEHTERERGGLIFSTGQILQGIISQVKNSGDSAFDDLANKFTRSLVGGLPAPSGAANSSTTPEGTALAINSVQASWQATPSDRLGRYLICAKGTPDSFAYVLIGDRRSNLREVSPGQYCGAFGVFSSNLLSVNPLVELRSAFGNAVRSEVALPVQSPCSLEGRLALNSTPSSNTLDIKCAAIGSPSAPLSEGCTDTLKACIADRVLVYQATSAIGPYERITEIKSARGKLPNTNGMLQVVAVTAGGVSSLPVALNSSTK